MASGERGFTLLGVLFLVVLVGVGLAALGKVWETVLRREKEAELLFVGDQFRRAIESYHKATPGTEKHYPMRLRDLLEDPRFPDTVRHLRRLYRDPIGNRNEWGLVKQGNEITGVYSLATEQPLKTGGFPKPYQGFEGQSGYDHWQFVAFMGTPEPSGAAPGKPPTPANPDPSGQKPAPRQ